MKKKILEIAGIILVVALITTGYSIAEGNNDDCNGYTDPSSNSGDGNPDGSEYESPNGPYGENCPGNGYATPAPNSGDGVPDGPGW